MSTHTRRQYLKFAGSGLAAAIVLPGLASADSDRLDYERARNGDIEFEYLDLSFESDNGDFELEDVGVDLEVKHRESLELKVNTGTAYIDLEMDDNGREIDLKIETGSQYIDFEFDHGAVDLEADGLESFEDDDGEIEFEGLDLELEWDDDDGTLEISGDIDLELDTHRSDLNLEYSDGDIEIEFDDEELEYVGHDIELEWEFDSNRDKFDAKLRR